MPTSDTAVSTVPFCVTPGWKVQTSAAQRCDRSIFEAPILQMQGSTLTNFCPRLLMSQQCLTPRSGQLCATWRWQQTLTPSLTQSTNPASAAPLPPTGTAVGATV